MTNQLEQTKEERKNIRMKNITISGGTFYVATTTPTRRRYEEPTVEIIYEEPRQEREERYQSNVIDLFSENEITPQFRINYQKKSKQQGWKEKFRSLKTNGKKWFNRIVMSTALVGCIKTEVDTYFIEKGLGVAVRILPHQEEGRFWEGVHAYRNQTSAAKNETHSFLSLPDSGVLPDVSVLNHYPISKDNAFRVRDAEGNILYEKEPTQKYLGKIPENVKRALILKEDQQFYEHAGINWRGKAGAVRDRILYGKRRGGSSITEQVAKQIVLDRTESPASSGLEGLVRKGVDMLGAVELETRYDKEQILNFYANYVYFGNGNYGVEKAAEDYFGKTAEKLTFPEALFLVCLLNDPGNNPKEEKEFAVQWKEYTKRITKWKEDGFITTADAAAWTKKGVIKIKDDKDHKKEEISSYSTALQAVYIEMKEMGCNIEAIASRSERFYSIDITTTIDHKATTAAEKALRASSLPEYADATIVILDHDQGINVLLSRKYRTVLSKAGAIERSPLKENLPFASTIKPLIYGFAEENKLITKTEMFGEQTTHKDAKGNPWPKNNDDIYDRILTAEEALILSNNRITVQIYDRILEKRRGFESFTTYLRSLGVEVEDQFIDEKQRTYALGSQDITSVDLAEVYNNTFNQAAQCKPHIVKKIEIGEETIRYASAQTPTQPTHHPLQEALEKIAEKNHVINPSGEVGFKTGTNDDALVTRIAGFYEQKGEDYAFVIDVNGRGKSLGGKAYAANLNAPIARAYFRNVR